MKKVLALILTLAMALSLAACGKSADKPDKSNPNVNPEDAWKVSANESATGLPTKCLYDDNSNGFADIVTNYYTEWADLAAKGYLYPVGSSMKEELIPALAAGQLAMIVSTNSYLSQVQAAFGDSKDFGFIPMFSATDNGKQTGFCSSGNGFFIVDNGNKEAMKGAYEFVKFFTNVDNQIAWNAMTGYLPLYDDVYNSKEYQAVLAEYPYVQSVIEAMRSADNSAWYAFTATNNEYTLAGATCLEAVCNGTPVDQAIAEMCETINNAFEMYNATNS